MKGQCIDNPTYNVLQASNFMYKIHLDPQASTHSLSSTSPYPLSGSYLERDTTQTRSSTDCKPIKSSDFDIANSSYPRHVSYSDFISGVRSFSEANSENFVYPLGSNSSKVSEIQDTDSKMTAPSPTSYAHGAQYSPYPPQPGHDMPQSGYAPPGHPGWRPEWGPYPPAIPSYNTHTSPGGSLSNQSSPSTATPRPLDKNRRKRLSQDQQQQQQQQQQHSLTHTQQVYSFVPIPGAQQHKRPRRRYEEIERMYKCGYNGCDKAYGTLNHLNAHVTMQSHGQKRTPEEFKEIRKEWKARKKEEEAARKADDEQQRQQRHGDGSTVTDSSQGQQNGAGPYNPIPPRQLPPLGYQQAPVQSGIHHYAQGQPGLDPLQQYPPAPAMYTNYTHSSPYPHNQQQSIYQPRQTNPHTGAEETDADAEPDPDVPTAYTHN